MELVINDESILMNKYYKNIKNEFFSFFKNKKNNV